VLYQQIRPSFWRRHPLVTVTALAVFAWQLLAGWYVTVMLAAIIALALPVRRRRRENAVREAGLRARADYEYRLSLAGDARGTYGRYPPLQAGWFPDPQNRRVMRYFDGVTWTPYAAAR
jgi:hypothetical protein